MKLFARLLNTNWRIVAIAAFSIGILHILATLTAPILVVSPGYDQLVHDLPVNRMQILPPVTPASQPLPFLAPDARYALCRFDARDGAVAINARLLGPGWMLALYTEAGENFFSTVARPGEARDMALMLVPAADRLLDTRPLATGIAVPEKTLTVPAEVGLAIIRAPNQGEAYDARNLAEITRARCEYRKS